MRFPRLRLSWSDTAAPVNPDTRRDSAHDPVPGGPTLAGALLLLEQVV
jgi:hypothetical protein